MASSKAARDEAPASPGFNFLTVPALPVNPAVSLPGSPFASPSPGFEPLERQESDEGSEGSGRLLVMKFGGSSLAGAEHLQRVAKIIQEHLPQRPVVVLSAMGKTTNKLLQAAQSALDEDEFDAEKEVNKLKTEHQELMSALNLQTPPSVTDMFNELQRTLFGIHSLKEVSGRTRDKIASFGERISVRTFASYFNSLRTGPAITDLEGLVEARAIDSWDAGLLTSSGSGSAESAHSEVEILPKAYDSLAMTFAPLRLEYEYLPVVTGYIAKDERGTITTLGRDGSDLTATVIGAAIHAAEVQIWKDVSGVLTTDPQVVPAAKPLSILTFAEAAELSSFGAKVVHPAAVLPAQMAKVPISVRSSTEPHLPGTRIVAELSADERRDCAVVAMSSKRNITMIVIRSTRMLGQHGFLAHVFNVFETFKVSIDVISTSEVTVSLTLDPGYKEVDIEAMLAKFHGIAEVELKKGMAMLTLITEEARAASVLAETFSIFKGLNVNPEMLSHASSSLNITFIVSGDSL
eukprot:CAMPEP_0178416966 /NCGR_PEP_ID=MMETSP0689_2-20121128/24335_1 /TAXON_ID=160604 /ORGANISM="Amphidinium massartii, Strain CS-259" /LENGTH=519 /DNA_ID=CAMNT_0020038325 /DNA_START=70 /DNA_END=1626 /DNA_ORIENTATION=-